MFDRILFTPVSCCRQPNQTSPSNIILSSVTVLFSSALLCPSQNMVCLNMMMMMMMIMMGIFRKITVIMAMNYFYGKRIDER